MFESKNSVTEYLNNHPNATLKEYLEYEAAVKKAVIDAEIERNNKCIEWYKGLEGRCFLITFHSNAHIVLKVSKWPSTEFRNKYTCYNIYYNPAYIVKEENRDVNRYWFKNPYEKPYHGQNEGSCKEISEEKYNEFVEKCNKVEEIINSINIQQLLNE